MINIHTPGREFSDQDDVEKSLNGVNFSLEYQPNGDVFSLIYDLNIENDRVALVDAPKIVELAEEVQNLASRSINSSRRKKMWMRWSVSENYLNHIQRKTPCGASSNNYRRRS